MIELPLPSQQHPITSRIFEHNVMVIEPHPVLSELLFWMLVLAGYSATLTTTEAVLSPVWLGEQEHLAPPALLLIDVAADGMSSLETLFPAISRLYTHWNVEALPLLLLASGPGLQYELEQAGFSVLDKPFHVQALLTHVQKLIEQYHQLWRPSSLEVNDSMFPSSKQLFSRKGIL